MITMANECKRSKCGGLVWFSWNATQWSPWKKRKAKGWRYDVPWAGAHCYGITADAARYLMVKSDNNEFQDRHMGATLKSFLTMFAHLQEEDLFGACYLNPPVGHYMSHKSTTDKDERYLDAHWGDIWVQGGTRKDEAMGWLKDRKIMKLGKDLKPQEVGTVQPENLHRHQPWKTQAPPGMPDKWLGLQPWHNESVQHTEAGGEGITADRHDAGPEPVREQCGNIVGMLCVDRLKSIWLDLEHYAA